ncbi:cilia- and flagella-associated protein 58 [Scaptodrosophila lebanonensis]|uniref:Cilia- and flagella-associated protein 58 n=1 Tax=Drosophila lebanonensis TaxID=7225 RepID=A0A6J2SY84_DROLE|nr:cilia- and flagella-associated protein 58 [Scaptodrosophila lebanonensis]
MSKASGSEDEPLVPDDFDDDFFRELSEKMPEVTKALRQKDTPNNADNVQRLLICGTRYKNDLRMEEGRSQELREQIASLEERLENAARLTKLDLATIEELRGVIEGAWKQKDAAQIREQAAQDDVLNLREKLDASEQMIVHLNEKRLALASKRDDGKERERLNAEIKDLNKRLQIQRVYATEVEAMTQTLEAKNKELLKLLDETSSDAYNLKRKCDALSKELSTMKSEETKYLEQIAQMKSSNEHLTKVKVRQNLQILSLKTNLEHLNTQHNATCNKLAKITIDLEYTVQERDKNKRNLNQRINLLKVREDELIKLKQENSKIAKSQETIARKYAEILESKREVDQENIRLKTQLSTQDKELESMRRVVHHFEKSKENLTKERDVLKRDLQGEQQSAEQNSALYQESQHEVRALTDTINTMELKMKKMQEDMNKLKKEKAKKMDEIQNWIDKLDALQNEMHLKENYEIELKRTISDLEAKCLKLQQQHDTLSNERNNLQRNLQAMEDAKSKLREQIANLQGHIEALKEKVTYRDSELSKLQLQIDRMEKERRLLRNDVRHAQLGQQHTKAELLDKRKENDRATKSLQEDEQRIARLRKDVDNLMNEKNAISAALTKRNEEYARLKDNLDNLQASYDQTERQCTQCQDDMRLMRVEIKNLRTERNVLRKDRESAADLRQELLQMHRKLNQERIKARALQDEMLTPMNVHRWRSLRGKDPEKMDLIERIRILRKQILNQNVATLQKERALEESQQLYAALKEFMLKLPSYKVQAELNTLKATLSAKQRKLKVLTAELSAKEADEKSHVVKLEELKCNLAETKTLLVEEKRKKQKLLEERQILEQMQAQCYSAPAHISRTLGAGFKIVSGF